MEYLKRNVAYYINCQLQKSEECAELKASYISQLTFWWMNRLLVAGHRAPLTEEDVGALPPRQEARNIVRRFLKRWKQPAPYVKKKSQRRKYETDEAHSLLLLNGHTPQDFFDNEDFPSLSCEKDFKSRDRRTNVSLFSVLVRTFGGEAVCIQVWQLVHDVFRLTNPLIAGLLLDFMDEGSAPMWNGYLFSVLLCTSIALQSVCHIRVYHLSGCLGLRVRTAVMSAVFRKALTMDGESRQEATVGEIVNLMSVDAEHLEHTTTWLYMIWSGPLQLLVAMAFLYVILGPPMLAGLAVVLFMIPVNMFVLWYMRHFEEQRMDLKDSRLKTLSEVLNGIKILKMYAWETSFRTKINSVREEELCLQYRRALFDTFLHFSWTVAPFVVLFAMFVTYIYTSPDHYLSPKTAFVSYGFLEVIRYAINTAPMVLSDIIKSVVSLRRLDLYLNHSDIDTSNVTREENNDDEGAALSIEDGTFTWSADLSPTLKDINLSVDKGTLVAVVGSVGAGKSSLLSALLGEMHKSSGKVVVKGYVAYVPQQAWIQHNSLRGNVLFGKPMKQDFYNQCISACALTPDLDILPGGDMTEIGEKGINLSGGQKQRVSLARAVYSDQDVYLLDDPLSAVDIHVGMHIFDKVIGHHGLLAGKTRVLVTHGIQWLPHVDIVVMVKDGRIVETGSYDELISNGGPFAQYLSSCLNQEEPDEAKNDPKVQEFMRQTRQRLHSLPSDDSADVPRKNHINIHTTHSSSNNHNNNNEQVIPATLNIISGTDNNDEIIVSKHSTRARNVDSDKARLQRLFSNESATEEDFIKRADEGRVSSRTKGQLGSKTVGHARKDVLEKNMAENKHILVEEESVENRQIKWSVLAGLARALGYGYFALMITVFGVFHLGTLLSDIFLSQWTDDAALGNLTSLPANSTERVDRNNYYLAFFGGFGVLQVVTLVLFDLIKNRRLVNASRVLHGDMLCRILHAPMAFFDTTPVGRIVNRFSQDIDTIDDGLPYSFSGSIEATFLLLISLIAIAYSTPWFIIPLVPLLVFYMTIQRFYIPTSRQLKRLETKSRSPIYSYFGETLLGASVIRAFGVQTSFVEELEARVDENSRLRFSSYCANRWLGYRLDLLAALSVFVTSAAAVTLRHMMPAGLAGLAIIYAMSITGVLNFFVDSVSNLELHVISIERVQEYINLPIEAPWRIRKNKPRKSWPEHGEIRVSGLDLRYREGLDLVLKDVTFHVASGEKVGIVGRTGAGKSSLTLALFRLMELTKGSVHIDDVDTSSLGLHHLRRRLAILPQDPVIFSGSLRKNLDPFSRFTDPELWCALEHAHLKTFVSGLPDALEYECGEGGENLSVGQRQLLCLARTLLHKTRILLLDEATAAVDMETDDLIQQTLRTEFAECTVLTIAHRINTVMDYDKILVMENGQVTAFDSPQCLLQDPSSVFFHMVQSAGLLPHR